jgi:hypothetical protein
MENEVEIQEETFASLELIEMKNQETDSIALEISNTLSEYPEFKNYDLDTNSESYHIYGDFFGDKIEDLAVLIKDTTGTKIGIINYGTKTEINIIGIGEDSLGGTDYGWIGIFEKVEKGDTLWSNYVDDWRGLDEVPESELVQLQYNAIYAHAAESCGGGFIFWKDNKWNWLQQE